MYHNNSWGSSPVSSGSQMPANNPFLESSASNRFPALESSPSLQSSSSFGSQSYSPSSPSQFQQQSPYGSYSNQQQYTQWNGQPQQQTYNQSGFTGYAPPQQSMQSMSFGSYGQQYGPQFDQQSMYGGQLQSQSQPQFQSQYTGFPQYQQSPASPQQNVISQFDPYSGINGNTNSQNQGGREPPRAGPTGQPHPRDFIRSHKTQLESWDSVAWGQALSTFEELKRAWERRRIELQKHLVSGQYLTADDIASVNGMIKSSESNIDSVTASLIQMQEVHTGYKQSLDTSSRQRVREALNAGLQHLPEWP